MLNIYHVFQTSRGFMGLVVGEAGLKRVYLPEPTVDRIREKIHCDFPDVRRGVNPLPALSDALRRYFEGERVDFDAPLDTTQAAPFDIEVWQACRDVRYGATSSYKGLAERVRRPNASRAVGGAMRRNPFPIVVPCHRVVKSDGGLGHYSGPGGSDFKQELLTMERGEQPVP